MTTPPKTLSPSKLSRFASCALAFRLEYIDRIPAAPSVAATRGTVVHRALETLYRQPPAERTVATASACLDAALVELADEVGALGLSDLDTATFASAAAALTLRYFDLEAPAAVQPVALEQTLEVTIEGVRLRGIVDRLDRAAGGSLQVVDYKTGAAPRAQYEQSRLTGVSVYSLLVEEVYGERPSAVRLLYLGTPVAITAIPSDQSTRAMRRKVVAVWAAIERACERDDFRPRPSRLCDWCSYRGRCPACP